MNRRTSFAHALVAGAVVLTLVACGGDDDAAPTTDDTPVEEPAAEPADDAPADDVPVSPSVLTVADQDGDGTSVTVAEVDLPSDGFIAVHADGGGSPGPVIGVSDLLPAGTNAQVTVQLTEPLTATGTVFPMVHIDTNGNGVYEFGAVEGVDGPGTTADGAVAVAPVVVRLPGEPADEPAEDPAAADDDPGDASDGGTTITIEDFAFAGATEVPVGTTVVVTNADATTHTWSAVDGTFDSGALAPGESFEFTFTDAGEYAYFCNFHPSMEGTITVVP